MKVYRIIILSAFLLPGSVLAQLTIDEDLIGGKVKEVYENPVQYAKTDTFTFNISLVYDINNDPYFYTSKLITPMCETGLCKLVTIIIIWDLAGNYIRYQLPEGSKLTRHNHEPFSAGDYKLLHQILKDDYWPLASYPIEALVVDSTKVLMDDEVDAYSGATAPFVADNQSIPGALYTVYTLYEFVHDPQIKEVLRSFTLQLMDEAMIKKYLAGNYWPYTRLVLQKLSESNNQYSVNDELWRWIKSDDRDKYFPAIKLFDYHTEEAQQRIINNFASFSREKQKLLIDQLKKEKLFGHTLEKLIDLMAKTDDYYIFKNILDLLKKKGTLSNKAIDHVYALLNHENPFFVREVKQFLNQLAKNSEYAADKMKTY